MVEFGNWLYFVTIIIGVLLFIGIYIFLRKKSSDFQFNFILVFSIVNFSLHFIKQLFYQDFSFLHTSTLENVCAISTVAFPFIIYFSKRKNNFATDLMYYVGFMGGFLAFIYPTEVLSRPLLCFESIRFYFCHFSLIAAPLLLAIFGFYKPRLKNWYLMPLGLLGYELIIFVNTFIVCYTGLVIREGYTAFELFIDRQYCNSSLTFGPTDDLGIISVFLKWITPPFMKKDIFNLVGKEEFYWPVVWFTIPLYIFSPTYLLVSMPFREKKKHIN